MSGSTQRRGASGGRPQAIHISKSFTRMETASATSPRKRASTLQDVGIPAIPEARQIAGKRHVTDVFEYHDDEEHSVPEPNTPNPELKLPNTFDELPIEIKSLTDRFLESLSAKVYPTPLSADALSSLFQAFYERAASQIATHIATLSSRIGREKRTASGGKTPAKGRSRAGSATSRGESPTNNAGGEMLTPSEVADRRKARRLLELKRLALEDAAERAVCEKVYDRIWKHRSTDDDARDEKLRSRTAALSLVGIGLKELHMDSGPAKADVRRTAEEKESEIYDSLAGAREALQKMDEEHYPLGKLQFLTAAHKSIVETLSSIFPSSSSADEVLPTLIYTLITSPLAGINAVSNLNFIQRFRTSSKVDGEAAYCLVNLEAAISFLETVDLSSLRSDELPQGPPKLSSSGSTTPPAEKTLSSPQPADSETLKSSLTPISVTSMDMSSSPNDPKPLPSPRTPPASGRPGMQHRRISSMVQQQADRLEAGRENILNAADKIYDSINGTLDNSLQFVFGRFKDQAAGDSPLPKTLEDARKLVSTPSTAEEEAALNASGRSSPATGDPLSTIGKDNKMLELLGGRKPLRDRSADSTHSGGSGGPSKRPLEKAPKDDSPAAQAGNLFAQINPLNRFGVPAFARFGRPAPSASQSSSTIDKTSKLSDIVESPSSLRSPGTDSLAPIEQRRVSGPRGREDGRCDSYADADGQDDLNARETLAELRKIKPPRKRFLEVESAAELRLGEVEELLAEYRRLAKAIR